MVTFMDFDTGEGIILGGTNLTIEEANITSVTHQLRENRHYNVTVIASNIAGSAESQTNLSKSGGSEENIIISPFALQSGTHDVVSAVFSEGIIQTLYLENSKASGALFMLMYTNGEVIDFTKSAYLALDRNASLHYALTVSLDPGHYEVLVYDIERDGLLFSGVGYPAITTEFSSVNGQGNSLYE